MLQPGWLREWGAPCMLLRERGFHTAPFLFAGTSHTCPAPGRVMLTVTSREPGRRRKVCQMFQTEDAPQQASEQSRSTQQLIDASCSSRASNSGVPFRE